MGHDVVCRRSLAVGCGLHRLDRIVQLDILLPQQAQFLLLERQLDRLYARNQP